MNQLKKYATQTILMVMVANSCSTAQAIDLSGLTNRIYKQGAAVCSRLSQSNAYKQCANHGDWLLGKAKKHKGFFMASTAIAIALYAIKKADDSLKADREHSHNRQQEDMARKGQLTQQLIEELRKVDNGYEEEPNWSPIRGLILCGADPNTGIIRYNPPENQQTDNRWTALHFAVSYRDFLTADLLIRYGAHPFIRVKNKFESPYDLAEKMNDSDPDKAQLLALLTQRRYTFDRTINAVSYPRRP